MSIMEADNFDRPCIAARAPSLMEAGGARTLYLARDEELWADAICRLLDDEIPMTPADGSLAGFAGANKSWCLTDLMRSIGERGEGKNRRSRHKAMWPRVAADSYKAV